ncbi:hypothetical protein SORBI_3004G128633 [Sorghum bicolor]|uniref:Uncharacterized protein n=1 Tax=Sorghum bicolor TaxID=4558 RepID=A0A1Z5RMB7_SORBI|nr:hypothetical protein SORBI_3004G128633 [Sorghum bicolor]
MPLLPALIIGLRGTNDSRQRQPSRGDGSRSGARSSQRQRSCGLAGVRPPTSWPCWRGQRGAQLPCSPAPSLWLKTLASGTHRSRQPRSDSSEL